MEVHASQCDVAGCDAMQVRGLFARFDADGSGSIDQAKFQAAYREMLPDADTEEVQRVFSWLQGNQVRLVTVLSNNSSNSSSMTSSSLLLLHGCVLNRWGRVQLAAQSPVHVAACLTSACLVRVYMLAGRWQG